jgi:hypothetical protein
VWVALLLLAGQGVQLACLLLLAAVLLWQARVQTRAMQLGQSLQ